MRKLKCILFIFLFVCLTTTVYAGTAYVDSIDITANVNLDGSMKVIEKIVWDIEEDLNGVYRDIVYTNSSNILNSATDIVIDSVEVNGKPFSYSALTLSNGTSGMYNINEIEGGKQVKIFTPSSDEYKTSIITYTLKDVIVKYKDIAELYWNFIGDGWDYGIDDVNITVALPGISKTLKVFGHGPLNGVSSVEDNNKVVLSVNRLRSYEQVDARVLFDASLVNTTKVVDENKLESILFEEAKLANDANEKREFAKKLIYVSCLLLALGVILPVVICVRTYKKRYTPMFNGKYYRELVEDYGVAVMSKVLNPLSEAPPANVMLATLLDLVRKKYVEIEPIKKEGKKTHYDYNLKLINNNIDDLNKVDKHFIHNMIFVDTNEISLKELGKKNSKSLAAQKRANDEYKEWAKIIAKEASLKEVINEEKSSGTTKEIIMCVLCSIFHIIVMICGAVSGFEDLFVFGWIGICIYMYVIAFVVVCLKSMSKLTKKGIEHKAMWKAFKKFLLDFSKLDEHDHRSLVIWEHFLVYATALGVAKKVIKELKLMYPTEFTEDTNMLSNYMAINLLLDNSSMTSFTNSFNSATITAFSASSTSNGSGGGFSGGAGAGGGGGGGGGF